MTRRESSEVNLSAIMDTEMMDAIATTTTLS